MVLYNIQTEWKFYFVFIFKCYFMTMAKQTPIPVHRKVFKIAQMARNLVENIEVKKVLKFPFSTIGVKHLREVFCTKDKPSVLK